MFFESTGSLEISYDLELVQTVKFIVFWLTAKNIEEDEEEKERIEWRVHCL